MISWIFPRKTIRETSLLKGMGDIHTHILPGVDDGVRNLQEALNTLRAMEEIGIRQIYLTPHIMTEYPKNYPDHLEQEFRILKTSNPTGIELFLAGEYMLDAGFGIHLKKGLLTMGKSHVLVETSYLSPPPDLTDILYHITLEGYIPIIAHPERYVYMTEKDFSRIKENGIQFQMNLLSLSGYYGPQAKKNAEYLFKRDLYDYTGSDIHSFDRYVNGLDHLALTPAQTEKIHQLIQNNSSLFPEK